MSRPTHGQRRRFPVRGCHPLRPAFPDGSGNPLTATGLFRFRSPLLTESRLMSFPPATEMFQFTGFASRTYGFSTGYSLLSGLPHSEIPGSTIARISPGLIAACHALHRLSVPRHPPDALTLLDYAQQNPPLTGTSPISNASHEDTLLPLRRTPHRTRQTTRSRDGTRLGYTLSSPCQRTRRQQEGCGNTVLPRSCGRLLLQAASGVRSIS